MLIIVQTLVKELLKLPLPYLLLYILLYICVYLKYHPPLVLSIQLNPRASDMFVYTLRGHLFMLTLLMAEINSEACQSER